jgi:hypothetical protein
MKGVWVKTRRVFRRKELPQWVKKISCDSHELGVPSTHRAELRYPNVSRAERLVMKSAYMVLSDRGQYEAVLKFWFFLHVWGQDLPVFV